MAPERKVQLSLLERLTDRSPRDAGEPRLTHQATVAAARRALRDDLVDLLNTRQIIEAIPEGCTELERSVFRYGLPDLTSLGSDSDDTRSLVRRYVEEELRLFEPRLTNVRVLFRDPADEEDERSLSFVIEGMMKMDPEPERVVFDTVLEPAGAGFKIGELDDA